MLAAKDIPKINCFFPLTVKGGMFDVRSVTKK